MTVTFEPLRGTDLDTAAKEVVELSARMSLARHWPIRAFRFQDITVSFDETYDGHKLANMWRRARDADASR